MDLNEARTLSKSLMREHHLFGWHFQFTDSFSFAGRCKYGPRIIELNPRWVERASDDDVKETMLHEIAHAIVGGQAGHGYVWYRKYVEIGGTGGRVAQDNGLNATKRYVIQCEKGCENLGYRQRRDPRLVNGKVCRPHRAKLRYAVNA